MKRFLCTVLVCFLIFYAGQARAQMTSGTATNGSITAGGTSTQTFVGTSGQAVVLNLAASYHGYIKVYNPDTTYWTYGQDRFAGTLTQTGTFTVVISGYYSTDNGPYSLYYVRGSSSVSGGSLTSGGTINASLTANALTSYQFTGTAGQWAVIYTGASYHTQIYVYRPDGSSGGTWSVGTDRWNGTLPTTGTYTVVIFGYYTTDHGPYNLYYVKGADQVSEGTLVSTLTRSGTLPANGITSYQFTGTSGNTLTVTSTASYTRWISILKPDGSGYGASNTNSYSGTLPATGQYTLYFSGYYTTDTGPYTITLTTTPTAVSASTASKVVTCPCPTCDGASDPDAASLTRTPHPASSPTTRPVIPLTLRLDTERKHSAPSPPIRSAIPSTSMWGTNNRWKPITALAA